MNRNIECKLTEESWPLDEELRVRSETIVAARKYELYYTSVTFCLLHFIVIDVVIIGIYAVLKTTARVIFDPR